VSAPSQLVPVHKPDPAEIASGAVVEIGPVRFMRRQQVVCTGIFPNEISGMDIAQSTFTADFYLWMRYARGSDAVGKDPTDIRFPTLVRGSFDAKRPSARGDLDDGTTYRLWQVTGDFNNDYDLHHYPADRPWRRLLLTCSAALSRRRRFAISQWEPVRADEGRDNLVTQSALGDPRLVGLERVRELSGFNLTVEMRRRILATLAKTFLPLGLVALIMYASLYFPAALVNAKVTVAITAWRDASKWPLRWSGRDATSSWWALPAQSQPGWLPTRSGS
jgi:branched-chain amino acid transport system substrate-binding protein